MPKTNHHLTATYNIDCRKLEAFAQIISRTDIERSVALIGSSNPESVTPIDKVDVATSGHYFLDLLTLNQQSQNPAFKEFYERISTRDARELSADERDSFLHSLVHSLEAASKMPKLVATGVGSTTSLIPEFKLTFNPDGTISDESRSFLTTTSNLESSSRQPFSAVAEAALELCRPDSTILGIKDKIDTHLERYTRECQEQSEVDIQRVGIQVRSQGKTVSFSSITDFQEWAETSGQLTKEQVGFIALVSNQGVMIGAGAEILTNHRDDLSQTDKLFSTINKEPAVLVEIDGARVKLSSQSSWYEQRDYIYKLEAGEEATKVPVAVSSVNADISNLTGTNFKPTLATEPISFSCQITSLNTEVLRLNVPEVIEGSALTTTTHLAAYSSTKVKAIRDTLNIPEFLEQTPPLLTLPTIAELIREEKITASEEELLVFIQNTARKALESTTKIRGAVVEQDIDLLNTQAQALFTAAGHDPRRVNMIDLIVGSARTTVDLPLATSLVHKGKLSATVENLMPIAHTSTRKMFNLINSTGRTITNDDMILISDQLTELFSHTGFNNSNFNPKGFIYTCAAEENIPMPMSWGSVSSFFAKATGKTAEQILFGETMSGKTILTTSKKPSSHSLSAASSESLEEVEPRIIVPRSSTPTTIDPTILREAANIGATLQGSLVATPPPPSTTISSIATSNSKVKPRES